MKMGTINWPQKGMFGRNFVILIPSGEICNYIYTALNKGIMNVGILRVSSLSF